MSPSRTRAWKTIPLLVAGFGLVGGCGPSSPPCRSPGFVMNGVCVVPCSDLPDVVCYASDAAADGVDGSDGAPDRASIDVVTVDEQPDTATCADGGTACASGCTQLSSDPANCGACGHACMSVTNGMPLCLGGTCTWTCAAGSTMTSSGCDPNPPRPIAPMSTATVTTRRPTLRWALAAGTDGARVDVCSDRACSNVIATMDATGSSAAPTTDLPAGVAFWRVRGKVNGSAGNATSPTWEFFVPPRSAPVDTSWGSVLDLNGDGLADVAVGAPSDGTGGRVYVYMGARGGVATTPAVTLDSPDGASMAFGLAVSSAGDVNGDGLCDLMVTSSAAVRIYPGSSNGPASAPIASMTDPNGPGNLFGNAISSAGDVDRDGYGDVIVGASQTAMGDGRAFLFRGGATGTVTSSPAATIIGTAGAHQGVGYSVAGGADFNGDGFSDVVVSANYTGETWVYTGAQNGLVTTPVVHWSGAPGGFGHAVALAGDVNGDGDSDVLVAELDPQGVGYAHLFTGTGGTPATSPATTLSGQSGDGFGAAVSGGADFNDDGFSDVVVDAYYPMTNPSGEVYAFLGSPSGLPMTASMTVSAPQGVGLFGYPLTCTGDVDGDGFGDLVAAALPNAEAFILGGSQNGLLPQPVAMLVDAMSGGEFPASLALVAPTMRSLLIPKCQPRAPAPVPERNRVERVEARGAGLTA